MISTGNAEAVKVLLAMLATNFVTGLVTWHLAQIDWYERNGDTVVLSPEVVRIAPSESWLDVNNLYLPHKYRGSKVVIGVHPIQLQLKTSNGSQYMLSLRYDPTSGVVLENMRTDEVLVRYDPDIGFVIGNGIPDSKYLEWIEHTYVPQNPFSTPILLAGHRSDLVVNKLQVLTQAHVDADTYVGRAYHTLNPVYTGLIIVRGSQSMFLSDAGPILINDVDWSSVLANPDATAIVGGLVVTTNVLDANRAQTTSDATVWDDPGHLLVTIRQWSADSTCTSFRNLADTLVLESYMPDTAILPGRRFYEALSDIDASAAANVSQAFADDAALRVSVSSRMGVCNTATGTIFLELTSSRDGSVQTVAVETQPVMCGSANWQIVCQGRNTFLASVAS